MEWTWHRWGNTHTHTHTLTQTFTHTFTAAWDKSETSLTQRCNLCSLCNAGSFTFPSFFFFIFNPPVSHKHTLVLILTVGTISHNRAQTDDSDASASPRSLRCHNICCFPAFWHCRCSETDGVFLMACILKLERFFFFQAEHKLFNPLKTYFWCVCEIVINYTYILLSMKFRKKCSL